MTATSAEERTIGRNAFSSDSLAEIQKTQNPFSDECKQTITNQTFSMNSELTDIVICITISEQISSCTII